MELDFDRQNAEDDYGQVVIVWFCEMDQTNGPGDDEGVGTLGCR